MNERSQLWLILKSIVICVIWSSLYAAGGSEDFGGMKWLRRFLAPALFALWAFWRSGWNWRYLVQMPLQMAALTLPYGADDFFGKFILRGFFGISNGAASSVVNAWHKRWILVALQVVLVSVCSIVAGVFNPFDNAMVEQFFIGFIIIFIPTLTIGMKK